MKGGRGGRAGEWSSGNGECEQRSFPSTVVIIGASGFIGKGFLEFLAKGKAGRIKILVHRVWAGLPSDRRIELCKGDLVAPGSLVGLVEPGCTVVNLSYLSGAAATENLEAASNLTDACKRGGASRLIHCSTAVVAGAANARVIDERTVCRPVSDYEKVKLQIEELLVERSRGYFEVTILRPTAVFGPGGRNLMKLADAVMHGNSLINYARACLFNRRSMNLVCLDNVVAALLFLLDRGAGTDGEVFIVSDDDRPGNNYRDVERVLRQGLGRRPYPVPIVPLPTALLRALLRLSGRSGVDPEAKYSARKLAALGFRPPASLEQGLAAFVRWYQTRPADAPERDR